MVKLPVAPWLVALALLVVPVAQAAPKKAPARAPSAMGKRPVMRAPMDLEQLDRIVREHAQGVQRRDSVWQFSYRGAPLMIVADARHDRMRIISAIAELKDVTPGQLAAAMESNFHSALDARYASSRGVLYAAFIHPLSSLHPHDLAGALAQVATLAQTFGSQYTSGELHFGG